MEQKRAAQRENQQMLRKLNRSKTSRTTSESEKNQKLARLAGLSIPESTSGFQNQQVRNLMRKL